MITPAYSSFCVGMFVRLSFAFRSPWIPQVSTVKLRQEVTLACVL